MATQKRRIVYFSDEEWAHLRAHAKLHKTTVSGVLREMWNTAAAAVPAGPEYAAAHEQVIAGFGHSRPAPKPSSKH